MSTDSIESIPGKITTMGKWTHNGKTRLSSSRCVSFWGEIWKNRKTLGYTKVYPIREPPKTCSLQNTTPKWGEHGCNWTQLHMEQSSFSDLIKNLAGYWGCMILTHATHGQPLVVHKKCHLLLVVVLFHSKKKGLHWLHYLSSRLGMYTNDFTLESWLWNHRIHRLRPLNMASFPFCAGVIMAMETIRNN